MKLTDMKRPKAKRGGETAATPVAQEREYPWGLTLNLENDALKKLGITDLPEVGVEVKLHAVGKVTRVGEATSEGNKTRSVEIQITRLAVDQDDDEREFAKGYRGE